MKQPIILSSWKDPELRQLINVLQRWCCQVRFYPREENFYAALRKGAADLVIVDGQVAANLDLLARQQVKAGAPVAGCPVLVLGDGNSADPALGFPHHLLQLPLDLVQLHLLLQEILKTSPRRNLRMTVKLPGMIFSQQGSSLGDVLSLGTGGAFIKTGARELGQSDPVEVVIPLLGMKKELELKGQVLYRVVPSPENNYQQGVGVAFTNPETEVVETLQQYITQSLLEEVTPEPGSEQPFDSLAAQAQGPLAVRSREPVRRLFLQS